MAQTNFTIEMLVALEEAIATSAKEVWYGDKRVAYRSLDEMLRIRDLMRNELGLNTQPKRIYGEFSKGTE